MHIRRTIIATTIAIASLFATTACNLTSPVASLDYYAPSDGAQVDLGPLKARNLMYLVVDETHRALVGSFANSSPDEISFALKFLTANGEETYRQFTVGGYKVKSFGYENQLPLGVNLKIESAIDPVKVKATPTLVGGSNVQILLYTNTDQQEINVPVITKTENVTTYDDLFSRIAKN